MKTTVAALLHDIGKLYQRAEKTKAIQDINLYQQYIKNNEYIHGAFTAKFINENIDSSLPDYENFLNLSAGHHIEEFSIVKQADIVSSGHDGKGDDEESFGDDYLVDTIDEDFRTNRLNIIFNEISIEGKVEPYKLKLTNNSNLTIEKFKEELSKEQATNEYKELYSAMKKELDNMNSKGYNSYEELHQLLYPIIKEYTTTVPGSAYKQNNPTVSLFDHLKLTAALANCLKSNNNNEYALLDYDISGIQKFIYRVTEGKQAKPNVAKLLRTRSLYLSLLTDFIAYYIVNQFGLTYENVLYSSGGRGRILVPYSKTFKETMQKIGKEIETNMYYLHNAEISFSIAYSVVTGEQLIREPLDLITEDLSFVCDKKKKFRSVFESDYFNSVNESNNICPLCFANTSNQEKCDFCEKLLDINNKILVSKDKFIIEYDLNRNFVDEKLSLKIGSLGYIIFHEVDKFKLERINSYYVSINNHLIGDIKYYAKSNIAGKNFEEISFNSEGDDKLAVIKMDVDNLGYIFLNGIKQNKETISKNLTLSRMVDYFFSKKLVEICNKDCYKKSIYINYAGGDDLVIIVPASMSLYLIKDINEEFEKYTGYNKSFHISGGIDIFSATSPVRYAINKAEDYLSKSKTNIKKNSFTILDVTISNNKVNELLDDINQYSEALKTGKLSRSGVYEIYTYIIRSLENNESDKAFMKFIPLIAYSIKRNMNQEWFMKLKTIFVTQEISKETIEYYKVVFGYALMITRKGENNE